MMLHIIHDNRRMERYQPLMEELERQGITDYRIWEPVQDSKSVIRSINLSHKQIVAWAKENGLPEVCIFEDDICFPAEDAWEHFIRSKPSYFDIYLGGCYSELKQGWDEAPYMYTRSPDGFHCYIMAARYYDTFLNTPENVHVDTAQNSGIYKVCYPMIALQRPGFSANNGKDSNYNHKLKQEDVYGPLHNFS